MWCTKSGVIFQETKLIRHRAWTWTSDSKNQLLIVITCLIIQTVLPSFPSSVPHSLPFFLGTTSQMKHLHYNSCSRPPSGGSKLKHSSALLLLLSPTSLILVLIQKKPVPKEWLLCGTFKALPVPEKIACAWSILSAGLIFSVDTSFVPWFLAA